MRWWAALLLLGMLGGRKAQPAPQPGPRPPRPVPPLPSPGPVQPSPQPRPRPAQRTNAWLDSPAVQRMRALIRAEALRQGVPPELALATARVESYFDPTAEAGKYWHLDAARFERVVPQGHPYRSQRPLWHFYGLFQLHAPYHVRPNEHPRVLLDPVINTQRGVHHLKRLLERYQGDTFRMRLHYTNGDAADAAEQARILRVWQKALDAERELAP